ncbi:hypothetical protein AB3S75_003303 [Citrus x aurantiifolia]
MHDLIRDMALRITSKSPLFMVKAGLRLLKFPGEQEWEENLERVSLMRNDIEEIPSNMFPHCEILSTLLLQCNVHLQMVLLKAIFLHSKISTYMLNLQMVEDRKIIVLCCQHITCRLL